MSELITQESITDEDYRAIEEAVMETARGRWFLKEYAQRNRVCDTQKVLEAVEGLKSYIRSDSHVSSDNEPVDVLQMRLDIVDMTQTIDQLKAEISDFGSGTADDRFKDAQNHLSVVVDETEKATSAILASAENVQQIAWEMRDDGGFPEVCDQLDALATEIYTSCSFQDLTGQRLRKVVDVTTFLETRLKAMMDVWKGSEAEAGTTSFSPNGETFKSPLENGPAIPGTGHEQSDIDQMLTEDSDNSDKADHFEIGWSEDETDDDDLFYIDDEADIHQQADISDEDTATSEESVKADFDNVDMDLTEIPPSAQSLSVSKETIEEPDSVSLSEPAPLIAPVESEAEPDPAGASSKTDQPDISPEDEHHLDDALEMLDHQDGLEEEAVSTTQKEPAAKTNTEMVKDDDLSLLKRQVMFS